MRIQGFLHSTMSCFARGRLSRINTRRYLIQQRIIHVTKRIMLNHLTKFFSQQSRIMVGCSRRLIPMMDIGMKIYSRPFDEILFSFDSTAITSSSNKDDYCLETKINVISLT